MPKIYSVAIKTFNHIIKGIIPGVLILFLHFVLVSLFKTNPYIATVYYQNKLFALLRKGFDNTLGHIDLPLIYIILPVVIILLIVDFKARNKKPKYLNRFIYLFNYCSVFFFLFYFFWGYNYYCLGLEKRMGFDNHVVELDEGYIAQKLESLIPVINPQRAALSDDQINSINPKLTESKIRPLVKNFLGNYGYNTETNSRVKSLFPGALMRFRTSGIYIPYVLEGHFDSSIHKIQWPFTIAHEMTHAYAITDEKEANFAAFIACSSSDDSVINYSALITYWRYLAFALLKTNKKLYGNLRNQLSQRVQKDLDEINDSLNRYPEWMPNSRDKIYDQYLKSHGISEGIQSYDKMIEMIEVWNLMHQAYQ